MKQKLSGWFILKNCITSTTLFFTNRAFNVVAFCTVSVLRLLLPPPMKQESEKHIIKLKALSRYEMQNIGSSTYEKNLKIKLHVITLKSRTAVQM
jgi:hypothetical protein